MAGSEAEERVRAKAEAMLRRDYPGGRIIHELQLEQGGVRIDLACVTPDKIVVVEVKSEKDTLARLARQLRVASARCDTVILAVAEKHEAETRKVWEWPRRAAFATSEEYAEAAKAHRDVYRAQLAVERADRAHLVREYTARYRSHHDNIIDPRERFDLLWGDEMRRAIGLHFGGAAMPKSMTRGFMTLQAIDAMTGREIRRAVCAQLRNRQFPRADAPVGWGA